MTQSASVSPAPPGPMLYWDAVDGHVRAFSANQPVKFFYSDLPANWYGSYRAVSRDGTRLYIYALHENAIGTYSEPNLIVYYPSHLRLRHLDAADPDHHVGQIDLTDYPACRATQGAGCLHRTACRSQSLTTARRCLRWATGSSSPFPFGRTCAKGVCQPSWTSSHYFISGK